MGPGIGRPLPLRASVASALLVLFLCAVARAQPPAPYSDYELETLQTVLRGRTGEHESSSLLDPAPDGKQVEGVDVVVLNIIEPRDPAPELLNRFHVNTRKVVVARELLVRVGDRYHQRLVDESVRSLRNSRQLSLVMCVALRGRRADTVRLLVIVKDVWSLRLNTNLRIKGGQLEYLFLQPSEENLFGTHRVASGAFSYRPDVITFGGRFIEPRLADSRYRWAADANLIINHSSGQLEGSYGSVQYGVPLYSLRSKWAWGADVFWRSEIYRRYVGVELESFDATATPAVEAIPYVYDSDTMGGSFTVTRSFGYQVKHDLQFGIRADRNVYRAKDLSGTDPAARQEFIDTVLPVTDTRVGPFLRYHLHLNSFCSLLNIESMGLQEDYRLGPELITQVQPVLSWLGSSRDLINFYTAASQTWRLGDGLLRTYSLAALELDLVGRRISSAELRAGLRMVSPPFGIGRLIIDGALIARPRNYLNLQDSLGGGDRLRGYPSGAFIGKDLLVSNIEFRSRPVRLWTVQADAVAFFDTGDAFDGYAALSPKQGAGFGLRFVFPQLERAVTRIDWGFALTPEDAPASVFDGLVLTFRQAFGVPRL